MAAQSEREPGDIDMGEGLLDPMAQDEEIEQEMLVVEGQEQFPPQMDPEPEMGVAAEYDTPLPTSVKSPPRPPVKLRPIMVDRSCFHHWPWRR